MSKTIIVLMTICLLQQSNSYEVKYTGAMRRIMQQGDLSATVALDTLQRESENLYGLGAATGLKGEIIILEGKSYRSKITKNHVVTEQADGITAALLVYANVDRWTKRKIGTPVNTEKKLEEEIEKMAVENSIDMSRAFPFLIKSRKGIINYHIIDWKEGVNHSASTHSQYAKFDTLTNQNVTLLGFFSKNHKGVFTHHTSSVHIHVISDDKSIVGHVDETTLSDYDVMLP
jgi:acetolactate decarboxylase